MVKVRRGEVWLVCLDPTVGREIKKTRPGVIISPPEIHDYLNTVIVAPMTTGSQPAPFRPDIEFQGKAGRIVLEQLRCLDRKRLVKRLGKLDEQPLLQALETLQEMFAPDTGHKHP